MKLVISLSPEQLSAIFFFLFIVDGVIIKYQNPIVEILRTIYALILIALS